MIKTAIVLGGTHDHITLIDILKQTGYYVLLIDYNDNPPARQYADEYCQESTLDKEKVLKIATDRKATLVIATCIDQALLTSSYVSEKLGLPCHITYEQALSLTNKAYMKKVFIENNIPTSQYIITTPGVDYSDAVKSFEFPLVVKPADSNSSKGIKKVMAADDLPDAVAEAFTHTRSQKVVIEEFVHGKELSVDVAIVEGEAHVILITENVKNKNNKDTFTIIQNTFTAGVFNKYKEAIAVIAKNIAMAFNIKNGPLLIQLLANENKISVIEFSSRIGGGSKHFLIKKLSGFDMLDYFIRVVLCNQTGIATNYDYAYAAINYIYCNPGKIARFEGFDNLQDAGVIAQYFYYKTEGMSISNAISSADRPAGYMVVSDSLEEINDKMAKANQFLKIYDDNQDDIIIHAMHDFLDNQ